MPTVSQFCVCGSPSKGADSFVDRFLPTTNVPRPRSIHDLGPRRRSQALGPASMSRDQQPLLAVRGVWAAANRLRTAPFGRLRRRDKLGLVSISGVSSSASRARRKANRLTRTRSTSSHQTEASGRSLNRSGSSCCRRSGKSSGSTASTREESALSWAGKSGRLARRSAYLTSASRRALPTGP